MNLRAGEMDQRVALQSEQRTPNGQGGFTTAWANLPTAPTVWAKIEGMSGNEAVQASIERAVTQWRVIIRKRGDVTPKNRMLWKGLVLDIKSAMPWPKDPRAALLLICESGASVDGS